MAILLRKLGREEAEKVFAAVGKPQLAGQDLILAMALKLVESRETLRDRTLIRYLAEWGRQSEVRSHLAGDELDEAVVVRALALLTLEIQTASSATKKQSPLERARWTAERLQALLKESAIAAAEANAMLMQRKVA